MILDFKSNYLIYGGKFLMQRVFGFVNTDQMKPTPLRICDMGIEERIKEEYDFNNRTRMDYEGFLFQYTLDGCGFLELNAQTIPLGSEDAFLISFPDESRYYLPKENESRWSFFYLHFTGAAAEMFCKYIHTIKGRYFSLSRQSPSIQMALSEFSLLQAGKKYDRYESGSFCYQFLAALTKDLETPSPGSKNSLIEQAVLWMEQNFHCQKGLKELCQELECSAEHLSRQFRCVKGVPPIQYLIVLRIEHSLRLLMNPSLSIQEIATSCGFENGNYYTKVFRKYMHKTPTAYRETLLHG